MRVRSFLAGSGLCGELPSGLRLPNDGVLRCFKCNIVANDATVCAALGDLYYATHGSGVFPSGWAAAAAGIATDYCDEVNFGLVGCNSDGAVTVLCVAPRRMPLWATLMLCALAVACSHLNGRQLNGTLPASLGNITTLRGLCARPV